MNRFTHFELATNDLEETAAFYQDVFGWKVEKWEGPVDYWLVMTGDETTPGINGGLMHAGGGFTGTINTVEVNDIDAALTKVLAHGGEVVIPHEAILGVGYQAYLKDNTGIIIRLHQDDLKAGMGSSPHPWPLSQRARGDPAAIQGARLKNCRALMYPNHRHRGFRWKGYLRGGGRRCLWRGGEFPGPVAGGG